MTETTIPFDAPPAVVHTGRRIVECATWGDGPAVLLLHGAMGGYDQGLLLARAAVGVPRFRFIAPSRPGYLGTPLHAGRAPDEQADLCAAILDAFGITTTSVIAISGGGQCALQFALRHAARCRALVMISACSAQLQIAPPLRFHLLKVLAHIPFFVERLRNKAAADPVGASRRSIPDPELRARTLNDPEAGPLITALQLSTMNRMSERLPGTRNDIRQSRKPFAYPVEQISAPLLVVHGTRDEAVPVKDARSLAARVPGAELLLIQDGRHTSLFTHLHEIRSRVVPFLGSHATGAS
jgi:pimeloyl-ACP methyl ester carboxylesterase